MVTKVKPSTIDATPSATAAGLVEFATDAETATGTATNRAVTPANLAAEVPAASLTAAGKVELATAAEINAGADNTRAIPPDSLAGSQLGTKTVAINVFSPDVDTATGDAKQHYIVTSDFNGMDLIGVEACVAVAGITATLDVQVHNLTDTVDMLSTVMTIDTTEVSTTTAATPAVIDATNDDVVTDDIIRIDVDAVHSGTAAKGLTVFLTFRLP